MKKLLKAMLIVILVVAPWLMLLYMVGMWVYQYVGIEGFLIRVNGKDYLDGRYTGKGRMTREECRHLDKESRHKVNKSACDVINYMRETGWKWWLNK